MIPCGYTGDSQTQTHNTSKQSISGMTSAIQSVTFNNSENWIGAGSKSGVFKVFDLEENKGECHSILYKAYLRTKCIYSNVHTSYSCSLH